jgi:hypothetical protein
MTDTPDIETLDRIERWLAISDSEPNRVPEVCPVGALPRDLRGIITKGDLRALCARVRELEWMLDRASAFVTVADLRAEIDGALVDRRSAALGKDEDNG